MLPAIQTINNRYQIRKKLGEGAMGSVYRTYDRLNKHEVALKKVAARSANPDDTSADGSSSMRLTIAHEFQTLASLHHPNIIDVLDYGFDEKSQPYFTMVMLEDAQPLTDYAQNKPFDVKVNLLIQTCQALTYLHRRRIFHRDLKPDNALVTGDGQVKVLDFGLAIPQEQTGDVDEIAGTMAYIAPEVLQGSAPSAASDLYAVGVMAYEIFSGEHPFNTSNIAFLLQDIITKRPNMEELDIDKRLSDVIARLLEKEPDHRFQDAKTVVEQICKACDLPIPNDSGAIRESFLQAAQFVGRDEERQKLLDALNQSIEGQGALWLIGGESGVGKTRLIDELRIQATVRGALVLHGQGLAEGAVTYQMWRNPLRRALLAANISDVDAAILQSLVPDIDELLQRPIPEIPDLEDGQAGRRRLFETVASVFRQQKQPIVLLLEDLQWAVESLDLLKYLAPLSNEIPLLILGNYRDDEAPDLPQELPNAQSLKLERLNDKGIRELSISMLGESPQTPALLDFLKKETEGNVFFLVEVVRALAEDAGGLSDIGKRTLPAQVFAGGVRQVVQRRLSMVAPDVRDLLEIAAVVGRYPDMALLAAMSPHTNMEEWLTTVAAVAILEPIEEEWRFSHDKLREGLLQSIPTDRRESLHAQIADHLQRIHTDNLNDYAMQIAEHYEQAKLYGKAANWHARAGTHTQENFAPELAINHYTKVLRLIQRWGLSLDETSGVPLSKILHGFSKMLIWQGRVDEANQRLEELLKIAEEANDYIMICKAWWLFANLRLTQGDVAKGLDAVSKSESIARANNNTDELVPALWLKGWAVLRMGKVQEARELGEELHRLANEGQHADALDQGYNLLGAVYYSLGDYTKAINNFTRAYELQLSLGKRNEPMATVNNVGFLMAAQGDFASALIQYYQAIKMAQSNGRREAEVIYRGNLAGSLVGLSRYGDAEKELDAIIPLAETFGLGELSEMQRYLAEVYLGQGFNKDAETMAIKALNNAYHVGAPDYIAAAWRVLGQATEAEHEMTIGEELHSVTPVYAFQKSLEVAESAGVLGDKAYTLKAWALYEAAQGQNDSASEKWQQARELFAQIGATYLHQAMTKDLPN
jgi:tetratricopeptide (TPR) repeat protein/tRNA A-37 threonylcarbamoyl transferase component Bud32